MELAVDRVEVAADLHVEPVDGGGDGPLVLDGRGLALRSVAVDGRVLVEGEYTVDDRSLVVPLREGLHVVSTVVVPTIDASHDKGIIVRDGLLNTNCEPQGFRRITWFVDRPANRATFDVTLVGDARSFPVMLTNGDLVASGTFEDGRRWVRHVDPVDKPSYLFSMVAGDLATRTAEHVTRSGRTIRLTVAAPPASVDGAGYALWAMREAMAYDEAHGGVEHDLDHLTFVAVPGYPDATEYHGLMFFEPSILVVDTRGFVDDDLLLIAANVSHEYGHHVRGNRVTVRTWGELALKEGLTVLTAQNDFRRHMFGPVGRVLDVLDLRRLQFPEEVTLGAPVYRGEVPDPNALYTRTTYLKGAEVFGMLRTLLGNERWEALLTSFVARHDLGSAGLDDFESATREIAPELADDIVGVVRWFRQAGRPSLTIEASRLGSLTLRRTDGLTDDPPLAMPVVLGFRTSAGAPLEVGLDGGGLAAEHTVVLRSRERVVRVDAPRPYVVSPLRGYSAPVDLSVDHSEEHLAVLLEHDDDPFARWWSSEELMIRVIDARRAGDAPAAAAALDVLVDVVARVAPTEHDPVLLAQILSLPDEFMLGDREPRIDIDGVADGLAHLRAELGRRLLEPLLDVWQRWSGDDPASTSPADIGMRMLVEPVLALLLASGGAEARALAVGELQSANSTRAVRALAQLAHLDDVPLDAMLADTYARWQGAPKLVDRWLRAQSGSRRTDTIDRVRALAAGSLYDRADRGRVMAVWFPFATRNRSVFHHSSGEGYQVFVDELGELMPRNAGLAVRLVGDLLQFQRFDDHRRALMRVQLERLTEMSGMPDFAVGIVRNLLAG